MLSHISISSLTRKESILDLNKKEDRDFYRVIWEQYVSEMSVFYYDILVDYLNAIIRQGNYTVEDLIVFNEVVGKIIFYDLLNTIELFSFNKDFGDEVALKADEDMISMHSRGSSVFDRNVQHH